MRSLVRLLISQKRRLRLLFAACGGLFLTGLGAWWLLFGPIRNYDEVDGPVFQGHAAPPPPPFNGTLKIVNWNTGYAQHIETAVAELALTPELQQADILLLQEMTETAAEFVGETLAYNYVYYPASVHKHHRQNFGNAVFSRWPISAHHKLLLSENTLPRQHTRIATVAHIMAGDVEIVVYSIHASHFWPYVKPESSHVDTLLKDIPREDQIVIVGGDFNTVTTGSVTRLERILAHADMIRISPATGSTFHAGPVRLQLDHLFTRGLFAQETGIYRGGSTSDHYPLWASLSVREENDAYNAHIRK